MSAFPSYDEMSEEDKKSKGINQLIAKYFAPTGILALLILKSIVSPAIDEDAEAMPLSPATDIGAPILKNCQNRRYVCAIYMI